MIKNFDTFVNETFGMDLPKGSDPIIEKDSDNAMAKSQLTRTKDFVDMLIPIIDGMDDMEPWVQAKITKAEDYLNAVLNYYKGKDGITEGEDTEESIVTEALSKEQKMVETFLNKIAKEFDYSIQDAVRFVKETISKMKLDESIVTESFTDPLEGFPQSYKDLLNKLQRSNDRSERNMLINKMNVIRKKLKLKPLKNESVVTEAKRSVVHKAAKKGSYPVSIVVIRDGKVIAQELVKTPAEVPAAFNVIQSYHKHKGATVHIESKTGERLFSESLDEAVLDEFVLEGFDIEKLHFEMDPKKAEKLKIELGKSHGEIGKRNQIESGNYSLRKFRKTIGYWNGNKKDTDFAEDVFAGPEHYMTVRSTLGAGPHKKNIKKVKWNSKEYNKWLKTMATDNDGVGQDSSYGFEMAQNAEFEPGLIDWVKKSFRGEDPLQRIQWDIEGMMESALTEAKNTIGLAFKEEQDYLDFKEFIKDEKGSIKKDFGWDSKTKSWEVIMDVKVLDKIYGEGTPGNKESGWYGALPGDFESVIIESVNEGKVTKKSISKASDDLAKIIIELKDNLGKLQKSKTDEERAKYIEIAKDLTIKRKDASDSLNLAIAKLDKNAELDLSGKD